MKRAAFLVCFAAASWGCGSIDGTTESVGAPGPGNLKVTAVITSCPAITAFSASPVRATIGAPVLLAGTAVDLNNVKLSLYWTTTSGVLADADRADTTYQCLAPGAATLTLTASNGVCTDEVNLDVDCDGP